MLLVRAVVSLESKTRSNRMNAKEFTQTLEEAVLFMRQQQEEIEKWKRMYKDMHNLATQAMSLNHQLEKEAQK